MSVQLEMQQDERWQEITPQQRRSLNELWDEYVVPALEQVDDIRRDADSRIIDAQGDAIGLRRDLQDAAWRHGQLEAELERLRWITRAGA